MAQVEISFIFFFLYACLCFTGSLAFIVGGDTVISSCMWKKTAHRYIILIYAGFLQERSVSLVNKQGFFPLHFFPHLSEKPTQTCLMPLAFAILCTGLVCI